MWSFGCVILEFLTWLLQGPVALTRFTTERIMATPNSNVPVQDDHFFMLKYDQKAKPLGAEVRVTVRELIESLYNEPNCEGAVRDMLQIVERDMLKVDPLDRIGSDELLPKLQKVLAEAETNSKDLKVDGSDSH